MAQLGNTFAVDGAQDAAGVREDLSDLIGLIDPDECPFQTMIAGKASKMTQPSHDWQTQALATANRDNAAVEGDDLGSTYDAVTPTVRINNRSQIFRRSFIVSETLNESEVAGRDNDVDFQKLLKGMEIRRDKEAAYLSKNLLVVGVPGTAPKLRALSSFIAGTATAPDTTHGASGVTPAVTAKDQTTALTAGTNRAITIPLMTQAAQRAYSNGGAPKYAIMPPSIKTQFSALQGGTSAGSANTRSNVNGKKEQAAIIAGVDVFSSDFGPIAIVPDRFAFGAIAGDTEGEVLFVDPRYVKTVPFRPYKAKQMATTGDAQKWMCIEECSLEVLAPNAHAKISDLTL